MQWELWLGTWPYLDNRWTLDVIVYVLSAQTLVIILSKFLFYKFHIKSNSFKIYFENLYFFRQKRRVPRLPIRVTHLLDFVIIDVFPRENLKSKQLAALQHCILITYLLCRGPFAIVIVIIRKMLQHTLMPDCTQLSLTPIEAGQNNGGKNDAWNFFGLHFFPGGCFCLIKEMSLLFG